MSQPVVIVAHGQPGNPGPQQALTEALARKVADLLPDHSVRGATLAAPAALEGALCPGALIYPMFMASGWFTGVELPRRLAASGLPLEALSILPPFGSDPGLPGLSRDLVAKAALARGWRLAEVSLLIAAHGSGRSPAPARAAEALAEALAPDLAQVRCGFVEEEPRLEEAARGLGPRAICLPFFATEAGHVLEDLPQALTAAQFQGEVLPPLGLAPQVPAMIAAAILRGAA